MACILGERFGILTVLSKEGSIEEYGKRTSIYKCKCDCGKEIVVSLKRLKGKNKKSCGCRSTPLKDLVGERFGKLLVTSRSQPKYYDGNMRASWICKCDCGKVVTICGRRLKKEKTRSCGCGCTNNTGYNKLKPMVSHTCRICNKVFESRSTTPYCSKECYRIDYRDLSGLSVEDKYFEILYQNLHHRKQEVSVTPSLLKEIWEKQSGICALSGQVMKNPWDENVIRRDQAKASLDRIDSSKGYVLGNIQFVMYGVNRAKSNLKQQDFIKMCGDIYNYSGTLPGPSKEGAGTV